MDFDLPPQACCLGCGYSLRGLTNTRCPECGRSFDPSDMATLYLGRMHHLKTRFLPLLRNTIAPRQLSISRVAADVALGSLLATLLGLTRGNYGRTAVGVMNVLFLAWILLVAVATIRWILQLTTPSFTRQKAHADRSHVWWIVSVVLIVAAIPPAMHSQSCPHATYCDIGIVGVARSSNGGPCNNIYWRGPHIIGNWWFIYQH